MVRRFVTLTLSFCLVLGVGISQVGSSFGQGETKKAAPAGPARDRQEGNRPGAGPGDQGGPESSAPATKEAPKATEAPLPPIPKEVQDKINAARKAVAEAIVAAQDAGLVETLIDPRRSSTSSSRAAHRQCRSSRVAPARSRSPSAPRSSAPGSRASVPWRESTTSTTSGSSIQPGPKQYYEQARPS